MLISSRKNAWGDLDEDEEKKKEEEEAKKAEEEAAAAAAAGGGDADPADGAFIHGVCRFSN